MGEYNEHYRVRMIAFIEEMKAMGLSNQEIVDICEKALGCKMRIAMVHKEAENETQS